MALINSYLLYKTAHPKITHKKFQLKVAEQLIGGYSDRLRLASQLDPVSLSETSVSNHQSVSFRGRPRTCRYCSKMKFKTVTGRTRKTVYGCSQCNVNLHKECFIAYHQSLQRKVATADKETQTGECLLTPSKKRDSVRQIKKADERKSGTKRRLIPARKDLTGSPPRKSPRKKNPTQKNNKNK